MSDVLIVGNVTKDVYLRLDNRQNRFERDQNETVWLDLAFDGSSHNFYERHSVFGGAAVTLEVLSRFGLAAKIMGSELGFESGQLTGQIVAEVYRYILCQDENIAYFCPSHTVAAQWQEPTGDAKWIYMDRSACGSRELVEKIWNYVESRPDVKLALYDCGRDNLVDAEVYIQNLEARAEWIFTEVEKKCGEDGKYIYIGEGRVRVSDKRIRWSLQDRQDLMTHLTTNSIIAASMLGALVGGKSVEEALLLARANVESADLNGTLSLTRLEEMTVGENYRVENISDKQENQNG